MILTQDQNAAQSHSIKIHNSSFECVEKFKYFRNKL